MPKRLPRTLYVTRKAVGSKDEFLLCAENFSDLAELGETVPIGVYTLQEMSAVDAAPMLKRR